jgi:hypothetical protein
MPKRVDPEYLDGPIPGMSLTSEPGARPWENPPVYVNVEDVVGFYTEQILDADTEDFIVLVMEKGISVETIANHLVTSGVMNGMHTSDVAFLVSPVVKELLMYVGDSAGVGYVESYDKAEKEKRIPRRIAKQIAEEVFAESLAEKEPEETAPVAGGLMARTSAPAIAGGAGVPEAAEIPAPGGLMSGGAM